VTTRSRVTALISVTDEEVRVRLAAPPVDDKANAALVVFVARCLDVRPTHLTLIRGGRSRHKIVSANGITHEDAGSGYTTYWRAAERRPVIPMAT